MRDLSRSQLLVYGAIAVALLLVGARWLRSSPDGGSPNAEVALREDGGTTFEAAGGHRDVVVHVAGAVRRPGVYRLPSGARVTDAVRRSGGPTAEAALASVNLAAILTDGQQIIIPAALKSGSGVVQGALNPGDPTAGPISLGTATVDQLDTIEGIGPVTAQKIIDFRSQNGGLSSVDDLDQIPGIGPATMEALRARLQP